MAGYGVVVNKRYLDSIQRGQLDEVKQLLKLYGFRHYDARARGYGLLREATRRNQRSIAKLLMEKGCKVNNRSVDSSTPLHFSVNNEDVETVKLLLERKAKVNTKDNIGKTPLYIAVERNHPELLKLLLAHNADVNIQSQDGVTPLHVAAKNGGAAIAKLLLNKGANINTNTKKCFTPLYAAVIHGHDEVCQILLEHGADLSVKDKSRKTLLHVATKNNYMEIAKQLISHGIDVNAKDDTGFAAAFYAFKHCAIEIVKQLLDKGADVHEVFGLAVQFVCCEIAKICLKKGVEVNVNGVDEYGMRPLHWIAVMYKKPHVLNFSCNPNEIANFARLLLREGSDVNAYTKMGTTALHAAAVVGNVPLLQVLLRYKPHIDALIRNTNLANTYKYLESGVALDVVAGSSMHDDCNVKEAVGITPLRMAVELRRKDVAELLLKSGAQFDLSDEDGMTELHVAVALGYWDIVKILVESGAEVDSRSVPGFTPLHFACRKGYTNIVTLLLEHRANVNIVCKGDKTILDYVAEYERSFLELDAASTLTKTVLYKHFVKLLVAKLPLCESNQARLDFDESLDGFLVKCEAEMQLIKNVEVDQDVNLCDILVQNLNVIANYSRNENVTRTFEDGDLLENFPIYADMMRCNFRNGQERLKHLEACRAFLDAFSGLHLPSLVFDNIFVYLSKRQLRLLAKCYSEI